PCRAPVIGGGSVGLLRAYSAYLSSYFLRLAALVDRVVGAKRRLPVFDSHPDETRRLLPSLLRACSARPGRFRDVHFSQPLTEHLFQDQAAQLEARRFRVRLPDVLREGWDGGHTDRRRGDGECKEGEVWLRLIGDGGEVRAPRIDVPGEEVGRRTVSGELQERRGGILRAGGVDSLRPCELLYLAVKQQQQPVQLGLEAGEELILELNSFLRGRALEFSRNVIVASPHGRSPGWPGSSSVEA